MKKSRVIYLVILIVVIVLLLILGVSSIKNNSNKKEELEKLDLSFNDRTSAIDEINYEETLNVGWIQVQGTKIDLPVLIVGINANLSIDTNYAWQSVNYKQGENREVIISHNLLNLSNQPSTTSNELKYFEELMSFVYYDFAKDNLYIEYTKDGVSELYVIYAVGFFDNSYDLGQSYSTEKNVDNYINMVKENSLYNYDIEVDSSDSIITLKTCTRFFGNEEKQQFQVDARKVREDEEPYRYKVEKSDLYHELLEEETSIIQS